MPRQARLDSPGTLHHVIIRGLEKREIVDDDKDRKKFVDRMGILSSETKTPIYAWTLMNNHAHILLKSGPFGLTKYMTRFLTGHAVYYNRRHDRHGHLFQNRYKSIIVEEDSYFQELVRYIHLNPLRAGIVSTTQELDRYPWSGHSAILEKVKNEWQDRDYVLKWFGKKEREAKRSYRQFVISGIEDGHRPDLTGGGLIRSQGGWTAVMEMRRQGIREKSDERILGSGEFVNQLILESEGKRKIEFSAREGLEQSLKLVEKICKDEGVNIKALKGGSRRRSVSKMRAFLMEKLVDELGISITETGRQLGVSASAVAKYFSRKE